MIRGPYYYRRGLGRCLVTTQRLYHFLHGEVQTYHMGNALEHLKSGLLWPSFVNSDGVLHSESEIWKSLCSLTTVRWAFLLCLITGEYTSVVPDCCLELIILCKYHSKMDGLIIDGSRISIEGEILGRKCLLLEGLPLANSPIRPTSFHCT